MTTRSLAFEAAGLLNQASDPQSSSSRLTSVELMNLPIIVSSPLVFGLLFSDACPFSEGAITTTVSQAIASPNHASSPPTSVVEAHQTTQMLLAGMNHRTQFLQQRPGRTAASQCPDTLQVRCRCAVI